MLVVNFYSQLVFYPFLKLQNAAAPVFFKEPVNYAVYIRLSNSIP